MHRGRNETKGRVKTFTRRRRKAEGNGWAEVERENEKRRMHRQRSFATPVTRCCIYSYTEAAPTPPMARSSACIPQLRRGKTAAESQRRGARREKREEKRREEKDKLGNSGHFYTFYLLWPPCLSTPALSVSLASCCEPRGVQENTVTPKKGETRERDSTIIGRGNGL